MTAINGFKIIHFTEIYKEKLKAYMLKSFPAYSLEYVDYCVANSLTDDDNLSLIVLDANDEIVGCHLFYATKIKTNGDVLPARWGHDTYLNKECRNDVGFKFVVMIAKISAFGMGLSDINREIQKKLKTVFMPGLYSILQPTCCFPFSLWHKIINYNAQNLKLKPEINVGEKTFTLVKSRDDLSVIKDGFFCGNVDYDFIRDASFIKNRFIENKVHNYYVYMLRSSCDYFVVRLTMVHGVKTLFLVDFRYNTKSKDGFKIIYKAVKRIARQNHIGLITFLTNDEEVNKEFNFFAFKKPIDFFAKGEFKVLKDKTTFITAADADFDFMRK